MRRRPGPTWRTIMPGGRARRRPRSPTRCPSWSRRSIRTGSRRPPLRPGGAGRWRSPMWCGSWRRRPMADNSSTDRGPANGIYLSDVLAMLRRRWYVVVVGLLLIAGGAGLTYLQTPKSYQATGQLLLLLPPQAGGSTPINPYLNLDSGLNTAAALVASTMNTPEMQRSVAAAGHLAQYTIALNPDTGPLLVITTEAAEPQQ